MTQITARVPDEILPALDSAAAKLQRGRAEVVRRALERYVEDFDDLEVAEERMHDPSSDPEIDGDQARSRAVSKMSSETGHPHYHRRKIDFHIPFTRFRLHIVDMTDTISIWSFGHHHWHLETWRDKGELCLRLTPPPHKNQNLHRKWAVPYRRFRANGLRSAMYAGYQRVRIYFLELYPRHQ